MSEQKQLTPQESWFIRHIVPILFGEHFTETSKFNIMTKLRRKEREDGWSIVPSSLHLFVNEQVKSFARDAHLNALSDEVLDALIESRINELSDYALTFKEEKLLATAAASA